MTELPLLEACPTCRLAVQGGTGPGGRAWHDCEAVLELRRRVDAAAEVVTDDDLIAGLKATIRRRAEEFPAKDLVLLLQQLQAPAVDPTAPSPGHSRGAVSGALLAFTREE